MSTSLGLRVYVYEAKDLKESAVASMSKGPFRDMFEEAREMLAGDSWATEAWKEKVGGDFF